MTAKYHKELSRLVNDVSIDAPTILLLDQANKEVHEWHRKWNDFSCELPPISSRTFPSDDCSHLVGFVRTAAVPLSSDDRGRKRLREQSLLIRESLLVFETFFFETDLHL